MKIIDENGKLFGKVHVFDIIIALVFVAVAIGAANKLTGGNIISFDGGTQKVKVVFWVETYEYRMAYLESLKVGDVIAEDKSNLDAKIEEIQIIDDLVTEVDNKGDVIVGPHPYFKKAKVKVSATLDYNKPLYDLGKQEIRVGAVVFLTTENAEFTSVVTDFQVVK